MFTPKDLEHVRERKNVAIEGLSDLQKAKLALELLRSIKPSVSDRAERDLQYYIDSASNTL